MPIQSKLDLAILELLPPVESLLGRKISPTLYTPAEFKRRRAEKDSFLNRVLAQPVVPLIGEAPDAGSSPRTVGQCTSDD